MKSLISDERKKNNKKKFCLTIAGIEIKPSDMYPGNQKLEAVFFFYNGS